MRLPLTLTLSPQAGRGDLGGHALKGRASQRYARSNRSAFITLVQAATKSRVKRSFESLWA
jgi:hypothetical protein